MEAGGAAAVVDGEVIPLQISTVPNSGELFVETDDGLSMRMVIQAGDGFVVVPGSSGVIKMHASMSITITATGFEPDSNVSVVMQPEGTKLASIRADRAGNVSAVVDPPADTAQGAHSIAMSGVDAQGSPRGLVLGVEIVPDTEPIEVMLPADTLVLAGINPLGVFISLIGLSIFGYYAIRRRGGHWTTGMEVFRLNVGTDR
jgi:hypothetical protein